MKFARFTDREQLAVEIIIARYVEWFAELEIPITPAVQRDVRMDISCVHARTPLRLMELAGADDFNFSHDIFGIRDCLNRQTGFLSNNFRPRFLLGSRTAVVPEQCTAVHPSGFRCGLDLEHSIDVQRPCTASHMALYGPRAERRVFRWTNAQTERIAHRGWLPAAPIELARDIEEVAHA